MRARLALPGTLIVGALAGYGVAHTIDAQQKGPTKATVDGITYYMPDGPPPPTMPFTPAVRVGDLIFVAGQVGTGADGKLVPGGIEAETRQALTNIKHVLETSGSSMDRVVKCTVFMADMKEWPAMNGVYTTFWPKYKPARAAFGATGLALNARTEIDCIAAAK